MNNLNNIKVIVRNIIGDSINGVSRVTLKSEQFNSIMQSLGARRNKVAPIFKFNTSAEQSGKGVYTFNFNGGVTVDVYKKPTGGFFTSKIDGKDYPISKPVFFMNTEQAKACLLNLEEERASEPKRPFDISAFNLDIVATA